MLAHFFVSDVVALNIYDLARKGGVPAHKMGREWRFDAEELDAWLKSDNEQREASVK